MINPPINETLRGVRILLTGSTGFLGKVWLEMALRLLPDIGHIYLLARKGKAQSPVSRFEKIIGTSPVFRQLREQHGGELGAWLSERITVLEGDVSLEGLGLADSVREHLITELDLVINFAGVTDFQPDPKSAEQINVQGAIYAADLAAQTSSKRLLHVSTCYVAGDHSGFVPEQLTNTREQRSFDPQADHQYLKQLLNTHSRRTAERIDRVAQHAKELGWPNIYTYSKALAERLLAQRKDIKLTLIRPSIVECALHAPFAGWNEGINTSAPLSWLIGSFFRDLPAKPEHRFDIIPVDTVARGVFQITSAVIREDSSPIYHLASSDINPLTFGRTIELNGLAVRRYTRIHGGSTQDKLLLQHLDPVGVPPDEQRFWNVSNLKTLAHEAKTLLAEADTDSWLPKALQPLLGDKAKYAKNRLHNSINQTHRQLRRVEKMLELYQPFIHDNNYEFDTSNIRTLDQHLAPSDREHFSWNAAAIDWRKYWVDIQYPGLKKWSIPLIHGQLAPEDPAPTYPIQLRSSLTQSQPHRLVSNEREETRP